MTVILERSPPSLKSEQNTTRANPALQIKLRAASLHRTLATSFVALAKSAMRSRYGLKLLYRLSLVFAALKCTVSRARRSAGPHRCATDFAIAKPCAGGSQTKISRNTPGPPKPPRAAKRRHNPSTRKKHTETPLTRSKTRRDAADAPPPENHPRPSTQAKMSIRVGINGFGRIGRLVMRAAQSNPNISIVGVCVEIKLRAQHAIDTYLTG